MEASDIINSLESRIITELWSILLKNICCRHHHLWLKKASCWKLIEIMWNIEKFGLKQKIKMKSCTCFDWMDSTKSGEFLQLSSFLK